MKEIVFLNSNAKRWKEFEGILNHPQSHPNPDRVADLFIELTDDLAYSRTYYPKSSTTAYLNTLTLKAHQLIYKNKREKGSRIITFWTQELPLVWYQERKKILYSFTIFIVAVLIGILSQANDETFARLILGDGYVNMTVENIKKNDPMAVYKQANEADMWLGITYNNIRVAFVAFIFGVFVSVGTVWVLLQNGIMLGCFQYFFFKYGVLTESMLTIWIHGTLEIWAIIVAGAAGLVMGNSILFPQTYSRLDSFRYHSRSGLKMVIGLVPIFITAAFFEGFITRHTEFPTALRLAIILGSLGFIVWYFFLYPNKLVQGLTKNTLKL